LESSEGEEQSRSRIRREHAEGGVRKLLLLLALALASAGWGIRGEKRWQDAVALLALRMAARLSALSGWRPGWRIAKLTRRGGAQPGRIRQRMRALIGLMRSRGRR
jgi:hypothetical protein